MKLPEETVKNFKILIECCREVCPDCSFSLIDSEDNEVWCDLVETLLESMEGGDELQHLEVWDSKRFVKLAWFGIMPYEPDGVCWNYCSTETAEKIFNLYFERINENGKISN